MIDERKNWKGFLGLAAALVGLGVWFSLQAWHGFSHGYYVEGGGFRGLVTSKTTGDEAIAMAKQNRLKAAFLFLTAAGSGVIAVVMYRKDI